MRRGETARLPGGAWHPRCTCPNAPHPRHALKRLPSMAGGWCSIFGGHFISGGVLFPGCSISGCSIPGCSISGQKWAEGHGNVIAPNHWHRWHVKSQYDTCHIFWPQEHWRLNISLIYFTGIFREIFCREDHPKYSLEYSTDWIAVYPPLLRSSILPRSIHRLIQPTHQAFATKPSPYNRMTLC